MAFRNLVGLAPGRAALSGLVTVRAYGPTSIAYYVTPMSGAGGSTETPVQPSISGVIAEGAVSWALCSVDTTQSLAAILVSNLRKDGSIAPNFHAAISAQPGVVYIGSTYNAARANIEANYPTLRDDFTNAYVPV